MEPQALSRIEGVYLDLVRIEYVISAEIADAARHPTQRFF